MAIQNRRGVYTDYDPSRLVEGEWAVVKSGDPNSSNGRSVYMCFEAGTVKRMATYEDMEADINSVTSEIQDSLTASVTAALSGPNGINARMTTIENDYVDLKADNTSQLNSMQSQVDNALTGTSGINTRMTAIEGDYVDLKNDNADELQSMQNDVDSAISDAQDAVAAAVSDAETATANANAVSEQIQEIIAQGGVVISVFGRSGEVVAASGDYSADQITYGNSNVADALAALGTYDNTPISGSPRPVTSGGVYTSFYTRLGILSFSKDSNNRIVVTYDE